MFKEYEQVKLDKNGEKTSIDKLEFTKEQKNELTVSENVTVLIVFGCSILFRTHADYRNVERQNI